MILRLLTILACLAPAFAVQAAPVSDWASAHGGAMRLFAGDVSAPGDWRAGVEIRLDKDWKTYWRYPGDAGVPPVFDWTKSTNVASVDVHWPAPRRFDDGGGASIGYLDSVVFPVHVRPKNPSRPAILALSLDYAICHDICVPAKGEASITLDPTAGADADLVARLETAEASVPVKTALAAEAPLSLASIHLDAAAKPPTLTITAEGAGPLDLFAEGDVKDWYLPLPQAAAASVDGASQHVFTLALDGQPKNMKLSGSRITFTLVSGDKAIETVYTLP